MSEQLWCVHLEGLNDFVAAASREAAEQEATAINAYLASQTNDAPMRIVRASAVEWPFTAAGHARSLEADWDDLQHMPHRRVSAGRREGRLSALSRRLKALLPGTQKGD
ncbi:hypothetical protein J8I87_08095 [Paraburkholderia sp. LEh10]|uniref:hypothetical protein n=1 Tax=Paraburkholderia sp. LEh10 TaxID=2821353 RepID=UPI001AE525AC|nr:hypothetical protein [Paraburkholderia sp. LEh10]MBP0589678.1 hypothetical protein [Paraburkholderia sp. LEh10]